MADNRMWMQCRVCGEKHFLAKRFSEWGTRYYGPSSFQDALDAFLADHSGCFLPDAPAEPAYADTAVFRLVYEEGEPNEDSPPDAAP